MRTKIWLTSTNTSHSTRPRVRRVIPWEATSRLLLFFHPGSFTRKPAKFDLRTLILFIWGRKWGAESGEEQLASGTTETKHLFVVGLGDHLARTQRALFSAACVFILRSDFYFVYSCSSGTAECEREIEKNEKEVEAAGGNVRNHNTGTWPLCELWLHKIEALGTTETTGGENFTSFYSLPLIPLSFLSWLICT